MQDRISQKNLFTGGMDSDTAQTAIAENDYISATNVRGTINEAQQFQILTNLKGNTLTSYNLPSGYNKCIGTYEDPFQNTLFYFVFNENNNHSILRYYPETNTIVRVAQDPVFGWTMTTNITHVDLVDNHLLYWVDPLPREIDVTMATDDKPRQYHVVQTVFTDPNPLNEFFTLTLYDDSGTVIITIPTIIGNDYEDIATVINALLDNGAFGDYLHAEACGNNHLNITFKAVNRYTLTYENTNGQDTSIAIPANFYPAYTERTIYRGKYPHPCPPMVSPVNDTSIGANLVQDKHFQFMLRLVMKDNSKSVYSPISDITLTDCASSGYNGIRVTFTNADYSDINVLAILQRVEIVMREGNLGKFQRIKTFEIYELWEESGVISVQYHDFFNNGNYEVIPDSDALRAWDAVGRTVACSVYADDRLFDGNMLENYNKPCPDFGLTAEFTEASKGKTFSVSGIMKIWVPDFWDRGSGARAGFIYYLGDVDGVTQPSVWGGSNSDEVRDNTASFGQQIAVEQTGFVIYDAMNPSNFCITRQNRDHGLPVTSTGALLATNGPEKQAILDYIQAKFDAGLTGEIFWSEWTLEGLTVGAHTLRVASHWCSFRDTLNKGSMYDLNGDGYHKTSMPIKTWTQPDSPYTELGDYVYEIRVEIDSNGDYRLYANTPPYTTVPYKTGTATNQNIYVGEVTAYDNISVRDDSDKRWCVDGYLIDAEGSSDANSLATNGIFMERQLVKKIEFFRSGGIIGDTGLEGEAEMIVDHNGYFFFRLDGVNTEGVGESDNFTFARLAASSINSLEIFPRDGAARSPVPYKISDTGTSALGLIGKNGSILKDWQDETIINCKNEYLPGGFINPLSFSCVCNVDSDAASYLQVMVYNTNIQVSRENRTRIKGIVQDANGVGIGGLSVLYERNGRQELTASDGSFEIIAYGDYELPIPNRTRTIDAIIIDNQNDCELRFQGGQYFFIIRPAIISFGYPQAGTLYGDNQVPPVDPALQDFDLGIIPCTITGSRGNRYLKNGGAYQFALLFVDEMFRRCDLVLGENIYIPFITENRQNIQGITNTLTSGDSNGYFTFTLNLGGVPEPWVKYVFVLRTLNANYNSFLQFPANDIKYVVDYDGTNAQETTYETSTATEIWVNLAESLAKYQYKHPDSQKGYTFVEGDRLRIITDGNGVLMTDNGQPAIFDFKILGERALGDSTYLIIENRDTLPKLEAGMLMEVYSPKLQVEKQAFYEIHQCIKVVNGVYEQTTIPLDTGDTYRRTRIVPVEDGVAINFIEDASISDFYPSQEQDIGRVSFSDPNFKEIQRITTIRFSGKFYEDTKVNNLSSFELLNVEQVPKRNGAINSMKVTNDDNYRVVILCICENNTISAYIGDVILSDLAGSDVVALSSKVLPAIRTLKGDFGTTNPESVAWHDGEVWWWDNARKRVIRYSLNGLFPISDYKMKSYFNGISPDVAQGMFDQFYEQYIITPFKRRTGTFERSITPTGTQYVIILDVADMVVGESISVNGFEGNISQIAADRIQVTEKIVGSFNPIAQGSTVEVFFNKTTVAFDEERKRWTSFYSFTPEKYGTADEKLISFKGGTLWVHDTNALRNTFYNIPYSSDVTFVFNQEVFAIKLFYHMRLMANSVWYCPNLGDISILPNTDYPTGMLSRGKIDQWEQKEGQWWFAFLNDANDPRFTNQLQALLQGRKLRGEVIKIRLQNDSTSLATLRMAESFAALSMLTEA